MKIQSRLFVGLLSIAFLALFVGAAGLLFETRIGNSGLDIGTKYAPLGDAVMEIKLTSTTAHLRFEEILSGDESEQIEDVWDLLDTTLWYIDAIISGGSNEEGDFIASDNSDILSIMVILKSDLLNFRTITRNKYTNHLDNKGVLLKADQQQSSSQRNSDIQFIKAFNELISNADTAEEIIHDSMDNQIDMLRKNLQNSKYILAGIVLFSFLIALVISVIIARGITLPVMKFQKLFIRGSEGDLTVRSTNRKKDEIGNLSIRFNDFFEKLGKTVSNIKKSAEIVDSVKNSLSASAEQTSATINNIKNRTTILLKESDKMDNNVSNNVASVEEITANINSIQDQINNQVAMVEESTAAITEMISSLQSVDNITRKKAESVLNLVKAIKSGSDASSATDVKFQTDVIDKIDGITDMANSIQAIAAQTNLLSMNAAIEAAHAGDAGRGFAVVADEIRKLADTASKSSVGITKRIKEISEGIEGTGEFAQKKVDAFVVMNKEIVETKNAFDEIVTSVQELNSGGSQIQDAMVVLQDVSSHIKNSAAEMTVGAEQVLKSQLELKDISANVNSGMMEINNGSEEIVIASDEIVNYSADLNGIVNELKDGTDKFII
jgi:methyl-accepting chemotaxis protein